MEGLDPSWGILGCALEDKKLLSVILVVELIYAGLPTEEAASSRQERSVGRK